MCFGLVLGLFATPGLAGAGSRLFFTLEIDGNGVGYQKMEWTLKNGSPHFTEETVIEVVHGKSRSVIKHQIFMWQKPENKDWYFVRNYDAGTVQEHLEGRIQNNRVQILRDNGLYFNYSKLLPAEIVYPAAQLQWYLSKDLATSVPLEFDYFDPQRLSSLAVSVSSCPDKSDLPSGGRCWLRAYQGQFRESREYWLFDGQGKLQRIETSFAGVAVVKKPCEENCTASVDKPWDFIGRLVVQSPYKISEKAGNGKINYLISSKSGKALHFLDSAEQNVTSLESKSVVSVCANCNATSRGEGFPDETLTKPNAWVQSDHHEIRRLALSAVAAKAPVKTKMSALVKLTQKKMIGTSSYVGYATALDALHSGSGDCSEFALLLAAFARAQGIPTRVVFGMAYSSRFTGRANVFSPHAWVQVWNADHWESYDAALGQFDATHIALATSDGNPAEVLEGFSQLADIKIEKAAAITSGQ